MILIISAWCLIFRIWFGEFIILLLLSDKVSLLFCCSLRDMVPIIITCWHILPFEVGQCFSEAIRYKAEHG